MIKQMIRQRRRRRTKQQRDKRPETNSQTLTKGSYSKTSRMSSNSISASRQSSTATGSCRTRALSSKTPTTGSSWNASEPQPPRQTMIKLCPVTSHLFPPESIRGPPQSHFLHFPKRKPKKSLKMTSGSTIGQLIFARYTLYSPKRRLKNSPNVRRRFVDTQISLTSMKRRWVTAPSS